MWETEARAQNEERNREEARGRQEARLREEIARLQEEVTRLREEVTILKMQANNKVVCRIYGLAVKRIDCWQITTLVIVCMFVF